LWVSRLNSTGMTEIGHQLALPETQDEDDIGGLQWLPGGKKISFIYRDTLYTVAAP
jgi:hypothetical protein